VVSIYLDIEKRRRAEEALRESERWLRLSQEIARIGHYVYDIPGDRWESSAALDAIFGIDASFPRKAADWIWLVHPDDRDAMREYLGELLANGTRFDREYRVVNQATGAACWVHGLGELDRGPEGDPVRLVGTIPDVNARKTAEAERNALQVKVARPARLAAMGTLVAGVAHEINNPLAAEIASQGLAFGAAREARRRLGAGEALDLEAEARLLGDVIENLGDAQEAGQRIAKIVRDFAAFGRPNPPRSRARLEDVVRQALAWLPASITQGATIRLDAAAAPDVLVAASQIEQVVINLVSNAAKAVPAGRKGTIVLRVGTTPSGAAYLDVEDDGIGIPREHLDRIFEPFFTTRPAGDQRGIGIGLAISHSIVEAHGGTLTVESEPGRGSTFRMVLPSAAQGE
jgi:PAS domain S-box-containing protein